MKRLFNAYGLARGIALLEPSDSRRRQRGSAPACATAGRSSSVRSPRLARVPRRAVGPRSHPVCRNDPDAPCVRADVRHDLHLDSDVRAVVFGPEALGSPPSWIRTRSASGQRLICSCVVCDGCTSVAARSRGYGCCVEARVVRISIAPVKSLGLVHPNSVDLRSDGVQGDRRFWPVDEDGRLFNNKRNGPNGDDRPDRGTRPPGSCRCGSRTAQTGGHGRARRPLPGGALQAPASVASRHRAGRRRSRRRRPAAHAALVGGPCNGPGSAGGTVSLVVTRLSRTPSRGGWRRDPVDGRRFRMMFELDGVAAHEEDDWIGLRCSSARLRSSSTATSAACVVTSHDPDRGITDLDTLGTLASYRPDGRDEPLPFGSTAPSPRPGRVQVGRHRSRFAHLTSGRTVSRWSTGHMAVDVIGRDEDLRSLTRFSTADSRARPGRDRARRRRGIGDPTPERRGRDRAGELRARALLAPGRVGAGPCARRPRRSLRRSARRRPAS